MSLFLGGLLKKAFTNVSSFVTQETWDQDQNYFIGHTKKKFSLKLFFKQFFATCVVRGMLCVSERIVMVEVSSHIGSQSAYGHQS